jgi:hypothetical protein
MKRHHEVILPISAISKSGGFFLPVTQTIDHAARQGNGNCMIYSGQPLRLSRSGDYSFRNRQ